MIKQKNRRHGLSKYDAPLRIQFEKGVIAFNRGFIKSPYNINHGQRLKKDLIKILKLES